MSDKSALRQRFSALRAKIPSPERRDAVKRLTVTVRRYPAFRSAKTVAVFASFRDEIPTDSLVTAWRLADVRVLLPRVAAAGNEMTLCDFSNLAALKRDRFGIRSPDGDSHDGAVDIVFVPGLAFGADGSRLGFGRGFYDRLLADTRYGCPLRCGLGFECQIIESLPMEERDVFLTHTATPDRVIAVEGTRCLSGPGEVS